MGVLIGRETPFADDPKGRRGCAVPLGNGQVASTGSLFDDLLLIFGHFRNTEVAVLPFVITIAHMQVRICLRIVLL